MTYIDIFQIDHLRV